MSEVNKNIEAPHNEHTINFELFSGAEFDLLSENERREVWHWGVEGQEASDGICPGFSEVGRMTIDQESLEVLRAGLIDSFAPIDYLALSEDDEQAQMAAASEGMQPLDKDTRQILRSLYHSFNDMVDADLARSKVPGGYSYDLVRLQAGIYDEPEALADSIHIDGPDSENIRYLLVLEGLTTLEVVGRVSADDFDSGGDWNKDEPPKNAVLQPTARGVLLRFLTNCDPHDAPTSEPGSEELRIFLEATIKPLYVERVTTL